MKRAGQKSGQAKPTNWATELWFPEADKELLLDKLITASVRAGDRTAKTTDPKGGYGPGRPVVIKVQKTVGQFDSWQTDVVVQSAIKKTLAQVKPRDLAGTPLPKKSKAELLNRLKTAYGRPFGDGDTITIVRFEYQDNLKGASDLIRVGLLDFAREPKANPNHFNFPRYTIPLIEHDYPALTPAMWNAAYRAFGLEIGNVMVVGEATATRQILDVLRRDDQYLGGGAGVGFKDQVGRDLDELDPSAEVIGAVNFILKTPAGKLKGFNTDGTGYAQSLATVFYHRQETLAGKKAVILGAGGAGNAVAFALVKQGMKVVILNRTVETAKKLAAAINRHLAKSGPAAARFGGEEAIISEVSDADAVINVSTKGAAGALESYSALAAAELLATAEHVRDNQAKAAKVLKVIPLRAVISDIVLRKGKELTPLLRSSSAAGHEILDGIPMVINQGVEAFWLLHGGELTAKGVTKECLAQVMRAASEI